MSARSVVAQALYGALFVLALPVALAAWARATHEVVPLPAIHYPVPGWATVVAGVALILAAMLALRVWGGGLPMNAFPPPTLVRRGPYRIVRHPIYVGFGLVCFGTAVAVGSPSGLWLVSPLTVLGMAALVAGFEGPDLRRRFGEAATAPPLLSAPPDDDGRPTGWQRAWVVLCVFLPWTLAFEAVYRLGVPPDAIEAYLPFERGWTVQVWTEAVYASVYLFCGLVPFLVTRNRDLRRFGVNGLIATALVTFVYVLVPVVAPPRPFEGGGLLGRMLTIERSMSHTVAAFPSFHVIWTLLAADAWSRSLRRAAPLAWIWAAAISASCITTGMHALADVAAAVVVWAGVRSHAAVWAWLRSSAERVANSWWEVRLGPARLLGYGVYAGLGGAVGVWMTLSLVGESQAGGVGIMFLFGLLGAALWAQKLEGSSQLSRPFGYFGSLVGAAAGALVAGWAGFDTSLLFAAVAVSAPWIQAIGRLRCLVQGCCHGRPVEEGVGIRYWDHRSRVASIGGLRGESLHPTPLYSALANVAIGILLFRLWAVGASEGLEIGLYLVLAGLARFVEESYRGEPQTPSVGGLRLYQWSAIVLIVVGAVATTVARTSVPDTTLSAALPTVGWALGFGLVACFAMGVDFPGSNRRYARLAPVE